MFFFVTSSSTSVQNAKYGHKSCTVDTQEVEQELGMGIQPIIGHDASDVTTTQLLRRN